MDRELTLREKELAIKEHEARRSRLSNPLVIAVFGAAIAAAGSAYVTWSNNQGNLSLERVKEEAGQRAEMFKAEAARIFELIKTGNPDSAAGNLRFLLDTGLIQTSDTVKGIKAYLDKRKTGEGVALPTERPVPVRNAQIGPFADLRGTNLVGRDLRGANLSDANLIDANLSGANLSGANLIHANLSGADLSDANLSDADLYGARNLIQAQLDRACGRPPRNLFTSLRWDAGRPCPEQQRNQGRTP